MTEAAVLALDLGNTRVKWGWHVAARWVDVAASTYAEFEPRFTVPRDVVAVLERDAPSGGIWCSVATDGQTRAVLDLVNQRVPTLCLRRFEVAQHIAGLDNGYRSPTLGRDRFAAALGAVTHASTGALVVASFGTATTIDTVSPDHKFLGGVILPGIDLMLTSLAQGTAQLPRIDAYPNTEPDAFPTDTVSAIGEGVMRAQLGAVHSTWRVAVARYGDATFIATGGASRSIAHRLESELAPLRCVLVDNLVLDGLLRAYATR